ncbi:hypothetical protein [Actinoallomurus sp. NPDC050550]
MTFIIFFVPICLLIIVWLAFCVGMLLYTLWITASALAHAITHITG